MLVASAGPFVKRSCERLVIISDIWTRLGAAMVEIKLSKPFAGKQSLEAVLAGGEQSLEAVLAGGESADHANFLKVCLPPEEIQRTYRTICAHIGEQEFWHRLITTKIRSITIPIILLESLVSLDKGNGHQNHGDHFLCTSRWLSIATACKVTWWT